MAKRAAQTSWKPGQSGNSRGRPPGSTDLMPVVRDLVNAVREGKAKEIRAALERVAISPRTVLPFLELSARLNRELGPGSEGAAPAVIILGRDATVERYRQAARVQSQRAE